MKTLIDLLHESARAYGDMPYLGEKKVDCYSTTSFVETDRLSLAFAAALVQKGFNKGDNISILSEGQTSWVVSEYGILKAGCIAVPLSTKLSTDEILFRINHSKSRAVLVSENCFRKIAVLLGILKIKPVIICLSERTGSFAAKIAKTGLKEGTDIFFYRNLLAEGLKGLNTNPIAAGNTFGGKPLTWIMREREKDITEDTPATIWYTQRFGDEPAGVMLTHRNHLSNANSAAESVELKTGWKSLFILPLDQPFAHAVGLHIFPLRGLTLYFADSRGGTLAPLRNMRKNLRETNPDFLLTVPILSSYFMKKIQQNVASKGQLTQTFFTHGMQAGIARTGNGFSKVMTGVRIRSFFPWMLANILVFPKLRTLFGSDIKFFIEGCFRNETETQAFFTALGIQVFTGYGLAECTSVVSCNSGQKHKAGTVGFTIPGLEIRILKPDGTECNSDEKGQIAIRGDSVMKGYFEDKAKTTQSLRGGWFLTNETGCRDTDGFLVLSGYIEKRPTENAETV